jgi:hypothetical protein
VPKRSGPISPRRGCSRRACGSWAAARSLRNTTACQRSPRRPAAVRSASCPLFGGAATAPPPASIAAYCSRAAPSSEDATNTRCRPPRPPRRLLMRLSECRRPPPQWRRPRCAARHARVCLQLCAWSIVLPLLSPKALPPEALAVAEDEVFTNPRELIFKFKSSLKTSAVAPHAVVVGVREAPCTRGRSSKGQLQQRRVM